MNPRSMPKASRSTLLMGARQLVVHEALEITSCFFGSYFSWLMPKATVKSWPLAGAEMITFFAPAAMCFCASTRLVNRPEHSSTMSQPCCLWGRSEERRVGEECRSRGAPDHLKKKIKLLHYDLAVSV